MLLGICVVGTYGITMVLSRSTCPARRDGVRSFDRARDGDRRRQRRRPRSAGDAVNLETALLAVRSAPDVRCLPLPQAARARTRAPSARAGRPAPRRCRPLCYSPGMSSIEPPPAPGNGQTGDRVRGEHQEHAEHEQDCRGSVGRNTARGDQLLERDEPGDECHPGEAHDAESEERRHQRPAAADAPGAVSEPHLQSPDRPVAPGAEQEPERAPALPEADVLERRQLVDGGCETGSLPRSSVPRGSRRGRRSRTFLPRATAKASTPTLAHATR